MTSALRGGFLALLAALLFGVSTPLMQHAGAGLGPFSTAALLYAGAALVGVLSRKPAHLEARLQRADLPRLLAIAGLGAVLAPVALAWGVQRTSGASASLMLTLEALFTVLLARWLYRETMDLRVWLAMGLLLLGGMVLVWDQGLQGHVQLMGLAAVLLATAAWGADNAVSRGLADRDPSQVVMAKAGFGVLATTSLAWLSGEPPPPWHAGLALLAIGATGYGLSLRLYLLAQRVFGAARTGSVFAFAPFIGAVVALVWAQQAPGVWMGLGGLAMLAGVWLHLAEDHAHHHHHEALEHEHAHTHDDGHHTHTHEVMPQGPHSHWHRHQAMSHNHPHTPDLHHQHRH